MLTSQLRYEVSRTHVGDSGHLDDTRLRGIFSDLEEQAVQRLRSWFSGAVTVERSAEMRYGEQIFEIDVPLDDLDWDGDDLLARVVELFHRRHEELYTYASPGQEVVLVNARVAAVGAAPATFADGEASASGPPAALATRRAHVGHWREVPVYAMNALSPGSEITGPAIIEAETTTVVVNEGDRVLTDERGWLDIRLGNGVTRPASLV